MRYLHTMVRVSDLDKSLEFYCTQFGLQEISRKESSKGKFTLVFLASPEDLDKYGNSNCPMLELTYNWESEIYSGGRNFGHLAFQVEDIYQTCQSLSDAGVVINRPPRDGRMAFVRSPDGISIELLQKGQALPSQEPWASLSNIGEW